MESEKIIVTLNTNTNRVRKQ